MVAEPQPENAPSTSTGTGGYQHGRYETRRRVLRFLIHMIGFRFLARLERVDGLENFPLHGPVLVMINHIAFVDSLAVLHTAPRLLVPLAKVEVYDYPVVGLLPRLWGVIPVRREEADRRAIQMALEVLRAGEAVLIAPEATRSPALQMGKEGVAYLASRANAPVLPVAIEGTPGFPCLPFQKRWNGPGIHVRFGRPFYFRRDVVGVRPSGALLRQMTDEAMYALAEMLPPERRGWYADLSQATRETISFDADGS